jgi:pimeloyl-ACP methyl ester carboxylesterase
MIQGAVGLISRSELSLVFPSMSARKSKILRMLGTVAIAYGLVLVAGCAWQRKLLYYPTKLPEPVAIAEAAQSGFAPWRNAGGEIIGWKLPTPAASGGSVLIVHGNAGGAWQRDYLAQPIHQTGELDVFVLEYPGYGARQGAPSLRSLLAAGTEAVALLPQDKPIYVVSESIGAGVAAHLARTHPEKVTGLVMFVPYDSMPALAQSKMPWLLPYLFLRDRYEPATWLKGYRGPVKIVLAGRDEIIPPKFGQRLYDGYSGVKTLEVFAEAGHNDVMEQSSDWWHEVLQFWKQNRQP